MASAHIPTMLYKGLLSDDGRISRLFSTRYGSQLLLAYHMLDTEVLYKSKIHGQGHIERVMLLGALIAEAEGLSERETRLLLFACSYHDTGRVNDSRDDLHGRRSADLIVSAGLTDLLPGVSGGELAALRAAIATHSVNDGRLWDIADEFGVLPEHRPLCKALCFCLKDADNLDRVRLGDLDVSHLRHAASLEMTGTAEYLLKEYIKYRKSTKTFYRNSHI